MFRQLRTIRTGSMPDQACAPSRQFRWHGRSERKNFAFIEFLQEECETIPPGVSALSPRDGVLDSVEQRRLAAHVRL